MVKSYQGAEYKCLRRVKVTQRALCSGKTSAFQADDASSILAARSKISSPLGGEPALNSTIGVRSYKSINRPRHLLDGLGGWQVTTCE